MTSQRVGLSVFGGILAFVLVGWGPIAAQSQPVRSIDLTFDNGTVTLVAENVSLRDVLAEWARLGGTRVVNAERLGGGLLPRIEFRQEPEAAVLRSLLRDVPGYGAAPRVAPTASASMFEALFILPSRSVPVSSTGSSPVRTGMPQQGAVPIEQAPTLQGAPRVIPGSPDSELPPVQPIQGELPPTTPGTETPANNPNLRVGPGGAVTSTVPGVVIPGPTTGGGTTPPTPPGRGRGRGGGGGR